MTDKQNTALPQKVSQPERGYGGGGANPPARVATVKPFVAAGAAMAAVLRKVKAE